MAKWIEFRDVSEHFPARKTRTWAVLPKAQPGAVLGRVEWYPGWRKYVFAPEADTVYEQDCLRDIAAFCEQQTREHRDKQQASASR